MKKFLAIAVMVGITGCSGGTPSLSCSDPNVTNLVLDISKSELKEVLFKIFVRNETSILPSQIADMSFDEFKAYAANDEGALKNSLIKTEQTISSFQLGDVRLTDKNEQTGSVACAANLVDKDGGSGSITFTAQTTDEGKLYVEVSGL